MNFDRPKRGALHPKAKLSPEEAAKMRQDLNAGALSQRQASKLYGISRPRVRAIKDGIAYCPKDY